MGLTKKEIEFVINEIDTLYPDAQCELDFTNPFELLIATILSAQCTDVRVNIVTKDLFEICKTPWDIVKLGVVELGIMIKTCGLSNSKSKNIFNCCRMLIEEHEGEIPDTIEALMKLPGVGRKTANVVVSNAFGVPAIAVDTHVFRVANRIGLAEAGNVDLTEKQLMKVLPKEIWVQMHHALIFHGRRMCKARKPLCEECPLDKICRFLKDREVK